MHIGNHPPETNYTMRQSDNILDIRDEITERDLGVAKPNGVPSQPSPRNDT